MTGSTRSAKSPVIALTRSSEWYVFWATLGAAATLFQAYLLVAWVASGDARPTPDGDTPIPGWMRAAAGGWEFLTTVALAATLWFFVVRPWRRDGRPSPDGLLCLAFFTVIWQDTLLDYTAPFFTWNTVFVNFGGWNDHIPGWSGDRGHLLATPLWLIGFYAWGFFVGAVIGSRVMSRAAQRWPGMRAWKLVGVCFAACSLLVFCFELPLMRLGFWSMPGAIQAVSLFPGHYYQFPLLEPILLGGTLTMWAALRHFRDDGGLTFAERGLAGAAPGPATTALRLLALGGACNLVFLLAYNLPAALINPHGDPWPQDVIGRSYLTDQQCGGPTTIRCGPANPAR